MKVSEGLFCVMDRAKLSPLDRFIFLDCCRRYCLAQRAEEGGKDGSPVPVRLVWAHGVNSCGVNQTTYRMARKRLVKAGLLDRCRDSNRVGEDGRPKVMRDWFVLRAG